MTPTIRQSATLAPREWAALAALAEQLDCYATDGPLPHRPSWRVLLRRIARGDLAVVQQDQSRPAPDPAPE